MELVIQSHAKSPLNIISVDYNSLKRPKLSCSASNYKPADPGQTPHTTGIRAPAIVKRRGQPRGHELTTIGLLAKKANKESMKKPCSFSKYTHPRKNVGALPSAVAILVFVSVFIMYTFSCSNSIMVC